MLELIQARYLSILTGTGRNNFILEWNERRDEELAIPDIDDNITDDQAPLAS